jgi:hypothetical protein
VRVVPIGPGINSVEAKVEAAADNEGSVARKAELSLLSNTLVLDRAEGKAPMVAIAKNGNSLMLTIVSDCRCGAGT